LGNLKSILQLFLKSHSYWFEESHSTIRQSDTIIVKIFFLPLFKRKMFFRHNHEHLLFLYYIHLSFECLHKQFAKAFAMTGWRIIFFFKNSLKACTN
jgi:hypothetical protein